MPMPVVDNSLVQGFGEWLLDRVTPETARDYTNIISKKQWPPRRRSHIRAWRNYVKYLFGIGQITWEQLQHYNLFLKTPTSKKSGEKRVEDNIIMDYVKSMRDAGYTDIAFLLLGGARLKHIVLMLNDYKPGEIVKHPYGSFEPRLYCNNIFCRYYLGVRLGSKYCDYIYYPFIKISGKHIEYKKLKDILNKQLGISFKLFRKYTNQRLEEIARENNIRLDAVNLILTRELSVTGSHYLDTRNWADRLFSVYVEYLKERGLV